MSIFGTIFSTGNDPEKIMEAVRERRQKAMDTGMPQLVHALYERELKYFPNWAARADAANFIPKSVSNILTSRVNSNTVTEFSMNARHYRIVFHSPTFMLVEAAMDEFPALELFEDGQKVLALRTRLSEIIGIDGFREGHWMKDFQMLANECAKMQITSETLSGLGALKMNSLKQNFGLR